MFVEFPLPRDEGATDFWLVALSSLHFFRAWEGLTGFPVSSVSSDPFFFHAEVTVRAVLGKRTRGCSLISSCSAALVLGAENFEVSECEEKAKHMKK